MQLVEVNWVVNPFRGDRFEEAWRPLAEAALDYGASAYSFFRSDTDRLRFRQVAYFDDRLDWERYWYSEQVSLAREDLSGWYQVPLQAVWYTVVDSGTRERGGAAVVSPAQGGPL